MRTTTRVTLAAAALLLGVAYVAPLWHIGLDAPQYPEGIGLYIWIDRILGQKPNDLDSINGLNHYIGMKAIVPDAIPELRLMPRIVGVLIAAGVLAALIGRRSLLYLWTAAFGIVAAAGLADFWLWGYDYGHDLDPTAAIKIPGFSYQPPLIGTKQLLNFTAHSWPGPGGWAIAASMLAAVILCAIEWRRPWTFHWRRTAVATRAAAAIAAVMFASGCGTPGPGAFHYDSDACEHCRMTISDAAFAAQLVTTTGRQYRFDDPGCLAAFLAAGRVATDSVYGIWLNDHARPDQSVRSETASVVVSDAIRAPMNGHAAAFARESDAVTFQSAVGGRIVNWAAFAKRGAS